jgi:hypothetical protein
MTVTYTRGDTLEFSVAFEDFNGNLVLPTGAFMEVSYVDRSRVKQRTRIEMSAASLTMIAFWDSAVAYPGVISWYAASEDINVAAQEGTFVLEANDANP